MFDVLLQPFKNVKLYHAGKCYVIKNGYLESVDKKKIDYSFPKVHVVIKGVLENVCSGLMPVKAGKHSYVVQPVNYNNGTLDIDDKTITCDVIGILIYGQELQTVTSIDKKGFEKVQETKIDNSVTLELGLSVGLNFSDKFVAEKPKVKKEINRYTLMDLDE